MSQLHAPRNRCMLGEVSKPRRAPTWKATVRRALRKLGPGARSLDDVYAAIPKSRKKKTWESTVRRTLQELRDLGEVGFLKSQGHSRRAGQYVIARRKDIYAIRDDMADMLGTGYTNVQAIAAPTYFSKVYDVDLGKQVPRIRDVFEFRFDRGDDIKSLEMAVHSLQSYYPNRKTLVTLTLGLYDEDDEKLGEQYMSPAPRMPTPFSAASNIGFGIEAHAEKGKYAKAEYIIGMTVLVDEEPS